MGLITWKQQQDLVTEKEKILTVLKNECPQRLDKPFYQKEEKKVESA